MSNEELKRAIAYGADKLTIIDLEKLPLYLQGGKALLAQYILSSVTEIASTYLWGPGLGGAALDITGGVLRGASSGLGRISNTGSIGTVASGLGTLGDILDPPGLYRFPLNPQSVDFGFGKLQTLQKYGFDAFELQYFGNDIVTMKCSGQTMMLEPPSAMLEMIANMDKGLYEVVTTYLPLHLLSPAWIKIHEFDNFYKQSSQELLLIWNWNVYFGYLTDFSYSWNTERAYRLSYNFGFNMHPTKQWKLFNVSSEAFNVQERVVSTNLAQTSLANLYF